MKNLNDIPTVSQTVDFIGTGMVNILIYGFGIIAIITLIRFVVNVMSWYFAPAEEQYEKRKPIVNTILGFSTIIIIGIVFWQFFGEQVKVVLGQ